MATSCSVVTITNDPWYGSLQKQGAVEFFTLDSTQKMLTLNQFIALWEDPTKPMIATYASVFAQIMTNYQTLCSRYPSECSIQGIQAAQRFQRHLSALKDYGIEQALF
jgi:hypothetical protein